jgi:Rrf2 family protein
MLSKKFQYAVHALQYLAEHALIQPVSIQEISDYKHIPKKFLEGILLNLSNAKIVSSKRGKDGGYYMKKS